MPITNWFRSLFGCKPAILSEFLVVSLENGDAEALIDALERNEFSMTERRFDDFCLRDDLIVDTASLRLDALNGRFAICSTLTLEEARKSQINVPTLSIDNRDVQLSTKYSDKLRNIARSYWEYKNIVTKTL